MNALTPWRQREWNPFKEMEEMQNRFRYLFDETRMFPLRKTQNGEEPLTVTEWAPLVDITEDEKEYLIKAELPEIKKEELHVTVDKGILTITGERKFEKEEKGRKYHRVERSYGSFTRSFTLPEDADGSKVSAEFKDGLLKVHLGKGQTSKPKAIEVKVA